MSEYIKRGIRGTLTIAIFMVIGNIFGYMTRLFLARSLTGEEYGLFYLIFTFFMFIGVFAELGYGSALIKFIPEFIVFKKKSILTKMILYVFIITFCLSIFASLILFLSADFLALNYFKNVAAAPLMMIFIFIIILNSIIILFQNAFQGFQDMLSYGLLYFSGKVSFLIFCILLFYLGIKGTMMPGLAFLISTIIPIFIFMPVIINHVKNSGHISGLIIKKTDFSLLKKITSFAIPNLLTAVAGTIIGYVDTLMLGFMVPLESVGVYNAVLPTVLIISYFSIALSTVFFPMVSELFAKKKHDLLNKALLMIYKYSLLSVLPFALTMIFFSKTIMQMLFGEQFISGAIPLSILSVGMIFLTLAQINFSVLNGTGKPESITKITIFAALLNLLGNAIAIPLIGMSGAALVTSASYFLMMMWSFFIIKQKINQKINFGQKNILLIIFASGLFLASLFIFKRIISLNIYLESAIILIISAIIYAGVILKLKLITAEEIRFILKKII